jgi:hypothetical protein
MPSKIILSYRPSDSDVITGRNRDNLANHYGEDAVFMDIDSIPLGFDYRELSDNKVMIAVIGPKWLGGLGKDARINANNVDGVVITFVSTSESITLRTARLTVRPTRNVPLTAGPPALRIRSTPRTAWRYGGSESTTRHWPPAEKA